MTAAEQAADLGTPGDGAAAPATKNEREEDSMARGPKGPPLHKLPAHVLEKGPGVINPPHPPADGPPADPWESVTGIFFAPDAEGEQQLWAFDGTSAWMLSDASWDLDVRSLVGFAMLDGDLYFSAYADGGYPCSASRAGTAP